MKARYSLFILTALMLPASLSAQLIVNSNTFNTNQLVQDVLVGQGVDVTNVTFSGVNIQRGFFNGANSNIGINSGVILSTGNIFVATGPNDLDNATLPEDSGCGTPDDPPPFQGPGGLCRPGDGDLNAILSGNTQTFDAAVLEFDFIPQSDIIRFNYVFGSEEYPEYVCSAFNDVFAFLISGPNPAGGNYNEVNIARIPGTTIPVAINTVNPGEPGTEGSPFGCIGSAGSLAFSSLYNNNNNGATVQFDGFTDKFEASASVIPCETYHIKIAIADAGDGVLDSAVFLEENSFAADAVDIEVVTIDSDGTISGDFTVAEGCDDVAEVTFSLSEAVSSDYEIPFTVSGTAINGTDYETLPGSIFIPAGAAEVTINIVPIVDAIDEDIETIVFEVQTSVCETETFTITIGEEEPLTAPPLSCGDITAQAVSFTWDAVPDATGYEVSLDGGTTWVPAAPGPTSHTVGGLTQGDVVDILVRAIGGDLFCSSNPSSAQTCIAVDCMVNANVTAQTEASCQDSNDGEATVALNGGEGPFTYQWDANASNQNGPTAVGLAAGIYTVTITDALFCPGIATVQITAPPPVEIINIAPAPPSCNGGANGSITITAAGGTGALSYNWSDSGGTTPTISDIPAGTYTITITDENNCQLIEDVELPETDALFLVSDFETPFCNGDANGTATVTATNGVGQLNFMWEDGQTTGTATGLPAGTYSVTVVDALGCDGIIDVTVTEPDVLIIDNLEANDAICNGENSGSAQVTPAGGTAPYTYLWQPGTQITPTASNLDAGTYTVTVTDDNGCMVTASAQINEPEPLIISNIQTTDISCTGESDGSITILTSGGTGAISFSIDNGNTFQNNNVFNNLPEGNYPILIQDENACTTSDNITLTVPNALLIIDIQGSTSDCTGSPNGTATVTVEGGTLPYTYLWNVGQTTPTATNLGTGNYTVSVTDGNGCQEIANVDVLNPETVVINSITSTPLFCNGDNTGTATVDAIGLGNLTYLWTPGGQSTATATGLAPGTYTVLVTGEDACTNTAEIEVTEPDVLTIESLDGTDITCNGDDDGTATLNVSGGTGDYTYQWQQSGVFGANPTGLEPGTYTVTVTDENDCSTTESVTINEPETLVIDDISGTDITCGGGTDGMASASASGGIGPLTYEWEPSGQTGQNVSDLLAGIHIVTVTDANGCNTTASLELSEPLPLVIDDISSEPAVCNGENTGSASVSVSGGTGAYTYTWQPSLQNTPTATNLPQGTYSVSITDERGCLIVENIDVSEPTAISANTASTPTSCNGLSDGTASIEGAEGTPPYTYQWDANAFNQTTQNVSGLSAGIYNVTITDANDCEFVTDVTVPEPDAIELSIDMMPVNCIDGNDGVATVTATGGTGSYTFEWDAATGNQTGATATNLPAGNYSVTVFDENNCFTTTSVTITQPATAVTAFGVDSQVSCAGDSDGFVSVIPTGGTGEFSFEWSSNTGSQSTQTAENLGVGDYTVTVSDANGCTTTAAASITEPTELSISSTAENNGCAGSADGEASVSASGGTPNAAGNYTYQWSDGQTGPLAINLPEGTYTITVTDLNGCTATSSVELIAPPPLAATIEGIGANCFGDTNGSVSVSVEGGIEPYTYEWSPNANGATTPDLIDLPMGTYEVLVTDQNGCTIEAEINIGQSLPLAISLSATDIDCYGESTATASVSVVGGTQPYTYIWSDSLNTQTISNLPEGTYSVTVTDANGCTQADAITVSQPNEPFFFTSASVDVECPGDTDGEITLNTSGGTPFYEYTINGGTTWIQSPFFVGLSAGEYTITARDLGGCTFTDTAIVSEPTPISANAGEDVTIAIGDSIQLEVTTDTPGIFTYEWSTFDPDQPSCTDCPNPFVSPTTTSTYEVLVTNEFGCTDTDRVVISVNTERNVFVANAFTPNGDGANDVFFVQGDEKLTRVVVLRVFDRWGELVYERLDIEANNRELGWDGTYRGEEMNPATFVWYAEVEFSDGFSETYQGDVTLIR